MMGPMAKKIGIAALVLLVVIGVVVGWMWHRVTALPDWYESAEMIAEDGSPRVDVDWVQIPDAKRPPGAPAEAEVYVLRNPHLHRARRDPIEHAIKQSRAAYAGGQLEAGAVVNMSEAELESLDEAERERVQDTIDAFPALTGRDVYVGVEGGVEENGGKITLAPDAQLRVGDSTYTLEIAAKRLGITEAELRKTIEDELARLGVDPP